MGSLYEDPRHGTYCLSMCVHGARQRFSLKTKKRSVAVMIKATIEADMLRGRLELMPKMALTDAVEELRNVQAGVDIRSLARWMGHASITTTQGYFDMFAP